MIETKTIVIDVDDTISTHVNRDYENATPHTDVIEQIRNLKKCGWKIVLFTARGQLSCNGDLALIEQTRRPALETWLKKHDVPYDELIFGKPLGVYYVDDKAMRPDEFVRAKFGRLTGGSGAVIEMLGDKVIKVGHNSAEQAKWYDAASKLGYRVPRVNCVYGDTLDMELIEGDSAFTTLTPYVVDQVAIVIKSFAHVPPNYKADWTTMIERVRGHMRVNAVKNEEGIVDLLNRARDYMNSKISFCHGDFTLENCIVSPGGVMTLIDPNVPADTYTSYLLDVGKAYQSFDGYEEVFYGKRPGMDLDVAKSLFDTRFDFNERTAGLICLMIHYIRMLKYKSANDQRYVRTRIEQIYTEVGGCF